MAEKSFPFAAVNEDRMYGAADWAAYFAPIVANGVFPVGGALEVSALTGMSISVATGYAWANGYAYHNDSTHEISVGVADGILNRIDRVVVRWGRVERAIFLHVLEGTSASTPSAPALTRDADYYDLCIAEIAVNAGIAEITDLLITDTRNSSSLCGIASQIGDTSNLQLKVTELENSANPVMTQGTAPSFTVPDATVEAYVSGMRRTIIAHANSGNNPTLNFNGLGAKNVYSYTGKDASWGAGQHVLVQYDGTSFFVCSGGAGLSLPLMIEAGDTPIYTPTTNLMMTFTTSTYVDTGVGFTALESGIYRIRYGLVYVNTYSVAKLKLDGVDVPNSEIQVASLSVSSKTIDVYVPAGSLLALWGRSTSANRSIIGAFSVSISMPEIQSALDTIITPR